MKKELFMVFITLLHGACAKTVYPPESPYFLIPAGSRLIIKQELTIPAESGRVYIQYGKVVPQGKHRQYYPHCWLVSWVIRDRPTVIKQDTFLVTRTQKNEELVKSPGPLLYASSILSLGRGDDGGPTAAEYSTILSIHSDRQPDIRRLICSHWEDPADAEHLTLAQINHTLGDIAELKLP